MQIREHAVLAGLISREIIIDAGREKGEDLIREIMVNYGHKRGERMRANAVSAGEKADIGSYLVFGEWQGREGENISRMDFETDRTVSTVTKCAWMDTWKTYGLEEYGKYYCRYIDQALCEGFNGSFTLEIPSSLGLGGSQCRFVWSQPTDGNETARKKAELKGKHILPFDVHCRELAECACKVLERERMKQTYQSILKEFEKLTGVSLM